MSEHRLSFVILVTETVAKATLSVVIQSQWYLFLRFVQMVSRELLG